MSQTCTGRTKREIVNIWCQMRDSSVKKTNSKMTLWESFRWLPKRVRKGDFGRGISAEWVYMDLKLQSHKVNNSRPKCVNVPIRTLAKHGPKSRLFIYSVRGAISSWNGRRNFEFAKFIIGLFLLRSQKNDSNSDLRLDICSWAEFVSGRWGLNHNSQMEPRCSCNAITYNGP